jgi:hypothetical protein
MLVIRHLCLFMGKAPNGPPQTPLFTIEGNCSTCALGQSVAAADIDLSGCSDVAMGSPGFESTVAEGDEGRVVVHRCIW